MKVLILGDLHFGINLPNHLFDRTLLNCFHKWVTPHAEKADLIVQMGDVFHNRRSINVITGQYIRKYFDWVYDMQVPYVQIMGNHDLYYNDTVDVNSFGVFLNEKWAGYDKMDLVEKTLVKSSSNSLGFVSWGIPANDFPVTDYLFGHFEITGFEYQRGIIAKNGYDLSDFATYKKVFSGHFHRQSVQGNVQYVGSIIPNNFGEIDKPHGIWILDTDTGKVGFIPVPGEYVLFQKYHYNNGVLVNSVDKKEFDPDVDIVQNRLIKIVSTEPVDDDAKFREILDEYFHTQNPIRLSVSDVDVVMPNVDIPIDAEGLMNIGILLKYYVNDMDVPDWVDKGKLLTLLENLYVKAEQNLSMGE